MKILYYLIIMALAMNAFGQDKELTITKAVMNYDADTKEWLYPSGLAGLQWIPNTTNYSYLIERSTKLVIVSERKTDTLNFKQLSKAIGNELKYIPFKNWVTPTSFIFSHENTFYEFDIKEKKSQKLVTYKKGSQNVDYHSGTKRCAFTIKNNLYIASDEHSDNMDVITHFSNKNVVAGQAIARFEFGISKGTFWSNAGNKLAFYQKDESNVHDYPLLDMTKTPGELKSIKYPMAGQRSELAQVGIFEVSTGKLTYLKTNSDLGKEHYLTNLAWDPTDTFVYLAEVNRDQNYMELNKYDATSGKLINTLFTEKNKKYVEPEHAPIFIPESTGDFLWFSEREGFMNLYHYDNAGNLINKVTKVDWVVQNVLGFSADRKSVIVEGTGPDPREKHAFSFQIATGKMIRLTKKPGTHRVQLSADGTKLIDSYSSLEVPKIITIINVNNGKSKTIHKVSNPLNGYKYGSPEFLTLKNTDGSALYGRIIKPSDFNKQKKYPVLVYVYGGPHAQLVTNSWLGGSSLWMNWFAEQGYLVFTLDGRGSANRGFEFESGIHRQLGTLEIEDQMAGVDYLKSLPYVDSTKMAVHGWSFGGFMTTSLMLKKPGTFKCGVAGGPVIDWKWYEIMYGERYMDTPEQNKEGYAEASLLDKVTSLEGDLLMIHGTVDDVVVMQHNLAFVKACVDQGVQIDFFPYPNHEHNVRGKDRIHLMTKVLDYVSEKLTE
ncbi:MAG: prolyl oligopeptidase family serine peptidase [Crocinitomicaceae bacterium]|nr:prolyl oligopeptidase family serine peptidase [Crocinitomicaceae bacterium]